jgi:hypothetical protein
VRTAQEVAQCAAATGRSAADRHDRNAFTRLGRASRHENESTRSASGTGTTHARASPAARNNRAASGVTGLRPRIRRACSAAGGNSSSAVLSRRRIAKASSRALLGCAPPPTGGRSGAWGWDTAAVLADEQSAARRVTRGDRRDVTRAIQRGDEHLHVRGEIALGDRLWVGGRGGNRGAGGRRAHIDLASIGRQRPKRPRTVGDRIEVRLPEALDEDVGAHPGSGRTAGDVTARPSPPPGTDRNTPTARISP